jgi:thioredoxin 1
MLAPTVAKLADEFTGKAAVGKLNVDENPEIAERYGIMTIPTVMTFKNGLKLEQKIGFAQYGTFKEMLENALK